MEKAERSVGEMLSVTDDPLLIAARNHRYWVRYNEVSMPFEELRYWAVDGGYALSVSDNRNTTIVSKEDEGRYLVKCPKCDDQVVKLVKRGNQLQAIACSRCRTRLVRIDSKLPKNPRRQAQASHDNHTASPLLGRRQG